MSWKSVVVLVATFAFDASLMAQDKQSAPFLGIWELNLEKTTNYPQQGQTMINVPAPGGGFISTRATIGKENKSSSTEIHPVVFDGNPHQTTGGDAREISLQTDRSVHDRKNAQSKWKDLCRYRAGLQGRQDNDGQAAERRPNLRQEI
jgi:hypothetical protein